LNAADVEVLHQHALDAFALPHGAQLGKQVAGGARVGARRFVLAVLNG
jgi:hypothetical protein